MGKLTLPVDTSGLVFQVGNHVQHFFVRDDEVILSQSD